MEQDFRKKIFRGAKIEDIILELERLGILCEEKAQNSVVIERQRFYEGMAIAYTTIGVKLKGEFDYIEPKVIDELYDALEKTSNVKTKSKTEHIENCSFCLRSKDEVGNLALGPGVAICLECLQFGTEVIRANT